ncbi:MAG: polyribonucleotide nucleotidyltransferase [Gemmatimonadetes bacterium]|nr:polyribonucleotide nucleotidyltransferase [Gemmatimonadota bacterium]
MTMFKEVKRTFAGRALHMQTGRLAKQAAGSALVQFGDTVVLAAVTVADHISHLPFFPLTVEYREKWYAAGKFAGGFIKREGRPSDGEILAARQIDRSLRPLFPKGFKNETQVFVYVISADQENDADTVGLVAASLALSLSRVPWNGPVAAVRIGRIEGEWVVNPTFDQLDESDIDLVVAGRKSSVLMVEGGALELSESDMISALAKAQEAIDELLTVEQEIIDVASVEKMDWTPEEIPVEIERRVRELAEPKMADALFGDDKLKRRESLAELKRSVLAELAEEFPDAARKISDALDTIEGEVTRARVLEVGERVDGRDADTVRPIECEVGILPRTHGSSLFQRGETQALVTTTLGSVGDEQRVDTIDSKQQTSKSFMLHYNFPPFSVGEVRPIRGVSRREIGHGMLAERALQVILPPYEEFPYTIRVVSEILESNGSSSMASVCGGSLALMDAGVPVKGACAGVAMGLIKEGDKVVVLTDILGSEDHLGDMDFKVAGTREGITSIQMDIKIDGLDLELLGKALQLAYKARLHILDKMDETLSTHRDDLSKYAPRIITIQINPQKIGDVIGPKGKIIRGLQEETGAEINIDDSGVVTISAVDGAAGAAAKARIEALVQDPEVGKIYEGPVKSTTSFGAFVEIMPGTEGLLHISELAHGRVEKTEDVVKKGDIVRVKLLSMDDRGRMKLSRKALLERE